MEAVTRSVHQIRTPMGPLYVNSHLVVGSRYAALVDTGLPDTFATIEAGIHKLGLSPDQLRFVLITHGHPDHIGSNAQVREHYPVKIIAPATSVAWIEDHERQYREFPAAFPDAYPVDGEFKRGWLGLMDADTPVDLSFDGGIQVNLGGGIVLVSMSLPGHSAHETAYYEAGTRCLILGDAIALDHPDGFPAYEDPAIYRQSLDRILAMIDSGQVEHLVAGHFEMMDRQEAHRLLEQSLRRIREIEAAVLAAVAEKSEGLTLRDACGAVAAKIGRTFNFQAPWTVSGHLRHLTSEGRLVERDGCWFISGRSNPR